MFPAAFAALCLAIAPAVPLAAQQAASQSFDSVAIGAFDPDAWNGIVFDAKASGQSLPFAIRIGSKGFGTPAYLDGERIYTAVSEIGPHAPDGSYAKVAWHHAQRPTKITLEWARVDKTTVVGRLTAPSEIQLVIEAYSPFTANFSGSYGIAGNEIVGEHRLEGIFDRTARFAVVTDRPITGSGAYPNIAQLRSLMDAGRLESLRPNENTANDDARLPDAAGLQFVTGDRSTAHFVATIGWDGPALDAHAHSLLAPGTIDAILEQKAAAYQANSPHVEGMFAGAPEAIAKSMFWNTLDVPALGLEFPSISRAWAHRYNGWVVGEWDCFFGSLLTAAESPEQTSAAIHAILLSQSPNGGVPNIASGTGSTIDRSQPPVGAYAVWKDYERHPDKQLLAWAYTRLKRWHEWWFADRGDGQPWRDGNRDGLLEWGSDRGSVVAHGDRGSLLMAKLESGMDDSPMYDDAHYDANTYTMDLDDVGLNSLYALDSECMAKIATILGESEDSRRFTADYDRIAKVVRDKLWNEQDGIYENRYWDGRFSKRLSPTNFYPMLAGIATPEQAKRMVHEHLLNPKEFWGEYAIPSIARNDLVFSDQYYWRGAIWGPTNYLVYEGLDRYGEDDVALDFASKSYRLFMNDWLTAQHSDENYYAWGGSAGGDIHYTWGALLCLIPMEQFVNENPWDGLRFGALNPPEASTLRHASWGDHLYEIEEGPNVTSVKRDGVLRFHADAGVVVRNYLANEISVSFDLRALRLVHVATTSELDSGIALVTIDGKPAGVFAAPKGSISFTVPAGSHHIVVARTIP
jgi:hypothetical protein